MKKVILWAVLMGLARYSTFSAAFKQRMGKSVTPWMSEEV
jgi:hypothetical protein